MSAYSERVSPTRSVVIWVSFALAMGGWVGAVASWIVNGESAGIRPGFIMGLTIACTFTITCLHTIVMPEKVKLYGLGFREGVRHAEAVAPEPEPSRRLTAVR